MSTANTDRNLLFGILALQLDFISRDALIQAMNAWVLDKTKTLGRILVEQRALSSDRRILLEALVQEHLKQHGDDPEQSLAAVSSVASMREQLQQIADADLQASLAHVSQAADLATDSWATRPPAAVGTSTSSGLRFRILRLHARGGLGQVSVAIDDELGREVAFKEIQHRYADNPDSRARFLLEAEVTGKLEHPGIVPVYGLGQYADGRPFYAMRFIKGDSLQEAIQRFHKEEGPKRDAGERTVQFRKLLRRFVDVCNAIAYAHSRGVLHRDLKPGNIMLGKYGETLVVDWGLAKTGATGEAATPVLGDPTAAAFDASEALLRPRSDSGSETAAGQVLGTPQFMSPEQAAGRLDLLGPASDVYSLGATLYCLLTSKVPFDPEEVSALLRKVERGEFAPPRQRKADIPRALEAICLKAMATRPQERYASPQQLAEDIERWLADEPVSAWPEPVVVKARRWMRQHKPLVSGLAASFLVALLALSAGAFWYQHQEARASRYAAAREQSIREHLDQTRETRAQLHALLQQSGGVQELLNQPARWQAQLRAARSDWQTAQQLAARAEHELDPDLTDGLQTLDKELTQDETDYRLALRLEKIRLSAAAIVEGTFGYAQAGRDYSRVFQEAGLDMAPGRQQAMAELIKQSAIKEQFLAALDHWAWVAHHRKGGDLCSRLLEVARLADPDVWRDQVRDPALWNNGEAMGKLAEEAQADQQLMAQLSPQFLLLVGKQLPQANKAKWLRQAQALHPADFWINFSLGHALGQQKQTLEAVGFYRVALALRPNTAAVYHNLGVNLRDQKDLPSAIDAYKRALAIEPNFVLAWYNLGVALQEQKDLPAAIDACKKALDIEPKFALAWNSLGHALRAQEKVPAAIDAFNKALVIEPKFTLAWYNLGNALHAQKDLPAARDAYKNALAIDPKYAPAWYKLGIAMYERKDILAAIDAYHKALAIEPNFAPSWNNLGAALDDLEDLPAATDAYHKALAIDPRYAQAWYNLAITLRAQKDLAAAIDAYKNALAIEPKYVVAWNNLGYALHAQKDLPAAIDAFNHALKIYPNYANAHVGLGGALRDQGDFVQAVAATQRALKLLPKVDALRAFAERQLKRCEELLALEQRLPSALKGEKLNSAEVLALADLCQHYKQRYRDAVLLYTQAFAQEPKGAEQASNGHRYAAACAAALAAAGKGIGADNLDDNDKARLRQQSLDWLTAALAQRHKLLEQNPQAAIQFQQELQRWQKDTDLASVRDDEALPRLPAAEQEPWYQLWSEVELRRKQARGSYTQTLHKGTLTAKQREQTHPLPMAAGKSYVIDLESPHFNAYLRLQDDQGKVLAENDNISAHDRNSRIAFTAKEDGTYRLIATSLQQRGSGAYTLTIRAFSGQHE